MQANDLGISVSLQAHDGAVQVAEGPGSCGVGWGLSAGGSITRQVRGLPDEFANGWKGGSGIASAVNGFSPLANNDLSNCPDSNETSDYYAIVALTGNATNPNKDTEPDLFYVSAPGLAAQFVFGTDGLPKLLTHQDLKIETFSSLSSIVVTNAQGIVYSFLMPEFVKRKGTTGSTSDQVNTMSMYYPTELTFVGRWHLGTMTSMATGTTAYFNYTSLPEGRNIDYLSSDSLNFITDLITPYRLSTITLKTYTMTFTWQNSLLSKVAVVESETQDSKGYALEYSTMSSGPFVKPFLLRVQEIANCIPLSSTAFEYMGVTQGQPTSQSWQYNSQQDFFGYYNGVDGNKNNPTLYLYEGESDGRRLRSTQIPGVSPTATISGDDRSVNDTLNGYGSLTKIKFPTGGYVQIEYEPNNYVDGSTSETLMGGGVRVKSITRQGSEVAFGKTLDTPSTHRALKTEYEYKLANGSSSGVLLSPVKLGYITSTGVSMSITGLGDDPAVLYTRASEIIPGQGWRVFEYSIPGVFPDTLSGTWAAARSRVARTPNTPCLNAGIVKNGYYTFPYAPSSNSTKRGLLTRTSEYSEASVLVRDRTDSTMELSSNPATIKALRFERLNNIFHYSHYKIETGRVEVPYKTIVRESSEADPDKWMQTTTVYTYNGNNMMSQVSTTLPDGTIKKEYMKYAKDFVITSPASSDTMALAIKKLRDQNRHGQVIEQISTITLPGHTETTEGASLTLFREFSWNRVLPAYSLFALPSSVITAASSDTTTFTKDGDYKTVGMYKAYDSEGRLLAQQDDKRNTAGYHYAVNTSTSLMTIAMARGQQCIYEGFEQTGSFGLEPTGATVITDGWTGVKAIKFTSGTDKVASSATNMIVKGGAVYRISCWVKAAANKTVTFTAKQGATSLPAVLTVTANNVWAYLEGSLSVSSITGSFTLEVTTDGTTGSPVIVDDIVFVPSQARVAFQTTKPFKGVTHATDDRGNSVKNVFDDAGRLLYTFDKDRNLISKNEYLFKEAMTPGVNAMFSSSAASYKASEPITFTADNSCGSSATRTWYVDDSQQTIAAPALSLDWTFTDPGAHTVKLVVNDPVYGTNFFTETICVEPGLGVNVQAYDTNGNPYNGQIDCSFFGTVRFTAKQVSIWYKGTYDAVHDEWSWAYITNPPPPPSISIDFYQPATTVLKAVPPNTNNLVGCRIDPYYYASIDGYTFYESNCN